MNTKELLRGSLSLVDLKETFKFKYEFNKANPEYFRPDGILCFCGAQGQGKTLSAVQYILKLAEEYPRMKLVTNVIINNYPKKEHLYMYYTLGELNHLLKTVKNDMYGVVYLIDEMHLLFNSLESKNIDISIFTEIAQQRKQRKHIVGTSQVFQRLAKPFREQFKYAVLCRCYGGVFQYNTLISGENSVEDANGKLICEPLKRYFWFHNTDLYNAYDTFAKIERERINVGYIPSDSPAV